MLEGETEMETVGVGIELPPPPYPPPPQAATAMLARHIAAAARSGAVVVILRDSFSMSDPPSIGRRADVRGDTA
jgi:hypothetical protein